MQIRVLALATRQLGFLKNYFRQKFRDKQYHGLVYFKGCNQSGYLSHRISLWSIGKFLRLSHNLSLGIGSKADLKINKGCKEGTIRRHGIFFYQVAENPTMIQY